MRSRLATATIALVVISIILVSGGANACPEGVGNLFENLARARVEAIFRFFPRIAEDARNGRLGGGNANNQLGGRDSQNGLNRPNRFDLFGGPNNQNRPSFNGQNTPNGGYDRQSANQFDQGGLNQFGSNQNLLDQQQQFPNRLQPNQLTANQQQQPGLNNQQQPGLNNQQQPGLNNQQQPALNNQSGGASQGASNGLGLTDSRSPSANQQL